MNALMLESTGPTARSGQSRAGAAADLAARPAARGGAATGVAAEAVRANAPAPARDAEALRDALERVQALDHRLSFQVDEGSGRTVVFVRDAQTKEVIKQFPAEEILAIARHMRAQVAEAADPVAGLLHTDEA